MGKTVLLQERGLKAGDVIQLDRKTGLIILFNPTTSEEIHFEKDDDKYLLSVVDPHEFHQIVWLIALTHKMRIEAFPLAESAKDEKIALKFTK